MFSWLLNKIIGFDRKEKAQVFAGSLDEKMLKIFNLDGQNLCRGIESAFLINN